LRKAASIFRSGGTATTDTIGTVADGTTPTTTVGVGPGGVTVGPRQRCRMVTTTVERDDGRRITRKERRCD
jgi:hypothetical protein